MPTTKPVASVVRADRLSDTAVVFVVEGPTPGSVDNPEIRKQVLAEAVGQVGGRPGISAQDGPYPVDADGNTITPDTPMAGGKLRFRVDYRVYGAL